MPTLPVGEEDSARRYKAICDAVSAGYPAPGLPSGGKRNALGAAAVAIGLPRGTMHSWWVANSHKYPPFQAIVVDREASPIPEKRSEIRDAMFWRAKAANLQKWLDDAERMAEQLAGLRENVSPGRIEWAMPDTTRKGSSVVGAILSDMHMGEVIDPEEIAGVNAFDPEICRARVRRFFSATCHVGARLSSDTNCRGAMLALGGDMISGDIHEELRVTNSLTSHEQVAAAIEEIDAGIRMLREAFGRVHVVSVPGNHSRVTHKPTAKLYSRASYDTLIASMARKGFAGDDRVTWQFGPDKDQVVNLFGFDHFITHGDKIGTRGGAGFAGPLLPIVRGTKKIEAQQASIGRKPDYIWHGHYHVSANAGNVLSNGSIPGYSEYASDLRASVEPPQQWLAVLHSHWGMRERVPIQLEDPQRLKPRVSVVAA